MIVFTALLYPILLWIVDRGGHQLVLNMATMFLIIMILLQILIPTVIMPMFFTFTNLEEGDLKNAVVEEAKKTNVSISEIKMADGSKRSSHSNAFVTGLWFARKVVIFDNLIKDFNQSQIIAVVNHELGHVAHYHIIF